MRKPAKNLLRLPLEKRAEMAFREAVEAVVEEHIRLKLPLHVWLDGKVVEVSPNGSRKTRKK